MTLAIASIVPNVSEAVRLLGVYTAGTYNVWDLIGSQKTSCRAHIMSQLLSRNMRPGVQHLQTILFKTAGIKPQRKEVDTEAEAKLVEWCKEVANGQNL